MQAHQQMIPGSSKKRLRSTMSSGVAQPNTRESDLLAQVQHLVSGSSLDGTGSFSVLVMAAAPDDAMEIVSTMPEDEFLKLERVADTLELTNQRFPRSRMPGLR